MQDPDQPQPQPIKAVLALRRISNLAFAAAIGFSPKWCGLVLNGLAEPSPEFRERAAEALDLPEEKLFRPPAPGPRSKHPGDAGLRMAVA